MLCLQLLADAFKLIHRALVLKVLQMPMKLQDVHSLIELSDPLFFRFKLVDVELLPLK